MHRTLAHLKQIDGSWPMARKMLVGPDLGWGRELLCTLARDTGGWVGWEAVTPKMLATELAFTLISDVGHRAGTDLEIEAVSEAALDVAIAEGALQGSLAALAQRPGIRAAVHDAIQNLRMSGLGVDQVAARAPAGTTATDLARILSHYVRILREQKLMDPANIFEFALEEFEDEAPYVLPPLVLVAGDLSLRGLRGQFVQKLLLKGAVGLDSEQTSMDDPQLTVAFRSPLHPVMELEARSAPKLFAATTPAIELREALRRALAGGFAWGDVEIAATDEDRYGIELEALTSHLGIPCTFRNGVPFARSRTGRAVSRFLAFLAEGLPVDLLRAALEAGELASPDPLVTPARMASRLRELKVGWGRERLEKARHDLATLTTERIRQREDESAEAFDARVAQWKTESAALATLLGNMLELLPPVPERGDFSEVRVTPADLARAVRLYLAMLFQPEVADATARADQHLSQRLVARLAQVESLGSKLTTFAGALTEVNAVLEDLRAWPELRPGSAGSSAGDAIHFTALSHAGLTGRRATFVVGLDADRVSGARVQDALLPDGVRHALDPEALPSLAARQEENAWKVGRALARLTGAVTLSYSVRGSDTGSATGPSHLLLDAWRRAEDNDALDYESLRAHLGEPVSAVPSRDRDCLDGRDAWLGAISDGSLLLDGSAQVRDGFPALDRGLRLRTELAASTFGPVHGLIADPAGLDPTASTRPVSASQLETLARCPLAWLYRYGMGIRPPDEPEYNADAWLSSAERGSLLHEVYEQVGREYQGRRAELESMAARKRVEAIAQERINAWREEVPPPSESVFLAESEEIRRAAVEFRSCEIEDYERTGAEPFEFEKGVEYRDAVPFPVGDRSLMVYGRIDRVDRLPDGTLRVVDFKTGSARAYQDPNGGGPFHGGRHLQAGIYASIAEQQLGATVDRFEYRFPTLKGGNHVARFPREDLTRTADVVGSLLEHPRTGQFVPTSMKQDCTFCDAAPICRVKVGGHYKVESAPRADWAAEHAGTLAAFDGMNQRRGEE